LTSSSPAMRVLVTGGSGFVGAAVVRALVASGYEARVMARSPASVPAGPAEVVVGDVNHGATVVAAASGCQAIIHCAADYRLAVRAADVASMVATNVGGTRNVLRAAMRVGVGRVVHCSTVGTLAFERSGRVLTEADQARDPASLAGPYKRSKWVAERIALGWRGLEVVVVQPSTPVGQGDVRPTPTGATIRDFLAGRIPAVVATGLNLVDVEAVGRGHVLALERGTPGRSYILGDRNLTMAQLLAEVAARAGVRAPRWRIPLPAAYAAAAASEAAALVRGRPPRIPLTAVRMAAHPMWVDSSRAREELAWSPGDLDRALRDAVAELGAKRPRERS